MESSTAAEVARRVEPPCFETRGRILTRTGRREMTGSVERLAHKKGLTRSERLHHLWRQLAERGNGSLDVL